MSGDILDTIDHVLADYEVSGDAMRWTPEPQPEAPKPKLTSVNLVERFDDGIWVWEDPSPLSVQFENYEAMRATWFRRYYLDAVIGASVMRPESAFKVNAA